MNVSRIKTKQLSSQKKCLPRVPHLDRVEVGLLVVRHLVAGTRRQKRHGRINNPEEEKAEKKEKKTFNKTNIKSQSIKSRIEKKLLQKPKI